MPTPQRKIPLNQAYRIRDLIAAVQAGDAPAAGFNLAAIEPEHWESFKARLAEVGGPLAELIGGRS